jgi:hypothetical protein
MGDISPKKQKKAALACGALPQGLQVGRTRARFHRGAIKILFPRRKLSSAGAAGRLARSFKSPHSVGNRNAFGCGLCAERTI